jgi:hypothetical protein
MPPAVHSSTLISERVQVRKAFFAAFGGSLLIVLCAQLVLIYCQLGVPTQSSRWAYEINQRKLQAAAKIQKPKLLLAGGSAALFGIQAELIESTLDYPTVNLGTHAALGARYMLYMVRQVAKPGDTIVLGFEYSTYSGRIKRDGLYLDYLLARDPAYFRELPLSEKFQVAMSVTMPRLRKGLRNRFRPERQRPFYDVYDPAKLNSHGDQLGNHAANRPSNRRLYMPERVLMTGFEGKIPPTFEAIEPFVRWARANGVRVYATYPNIVDHPAYHTDTARKGLERLRQAYERLGVPVIGSVEESMLPASAFYDTHYHLTREGARGRTERLIPHLAAALR